jgi:uncharacterized protein (DUF1697 family)
MTQYLALLRGINVGGANMIRMAALKTCFEASKLKKVATYIQSGNVLFEAAESDSAKLVKKIEDTLSKTFSPYKGRIVLCSHAELKRIVQKAPKGFGSQPQKYRYDVLFLKEPLSVADAMKSVTTKAGVDSVSTGPDVLYFSRLAAKASQSQLTRIISLPVYQNMTIRNWNTTSKLLALMDARAEGAASGEESSRATRRRR